MKSSHTLSTASALSLLALAASLFGGPPPSAEAAALGGPVVIGGDLLARHGERLGGANIRGWLYIEKAIAAIDAAVVAPGPFTVDIAALGPFPVANCPGACPDGSLDPGLGIGSVAEELGMTVNFYGNQKEVAEFFADLASGAVNPRIIWLAGCNLAKNALCTPSLDGESLVLLENAQALSGFVAAGGGLMAHGANGDSKPLHWLTSLLPDVSITYRQCESMGAALTAEGMSVLPTVSASDIDDTVAECTNEFQIVTAGGFRDMRVLALEGSGIEPDNAVCIGGVDEGLGCPSLSACPGGSCQSGAPFILGGGSTLLSGCGDDVVNYDEDCDGTSDLACPGDCFPPGDVLECRCNRCDVPLPGCKVPTAAGKAKISIKDDIDDDTKDKFSWKWGKGAATTKDEFEDSAGDTPLENDGPTYQLCVFDDADGTPSLIARAAVRADEPTPTSCNLFYSRKPCWKQTPTSYKYLNKDLAPFGVSKLDLKAGEVEKAKIKLKGKGRALELPSGSYPLDVPLKVQLSNGQTCWEADFSTAKVNVLDPAKGTRTFKAKSD